MNYHKIYQQLFISSIVDKWEKEDIIKNKKNKKNKTGQIKEIKQFKMKKVKIVFDK